MDYSCQQLIGTYKIFVILTNKEHITKEQHQWELCSYITPSDWSFTPQAPATSYLDKHRPSPHPQWPHPIPKGTCHQEINPPACRNQQLGSAICFSQTRCLFSWNFQETGTLVAGAWYKERSPQYLPSKGQLASR